MLVSQVNRFSESLIQVASMSSSKYNKKMSRFSYQVSRKRICYKVLGNKYLVTIITKLVSKKYI